MRTLVLDMGYQPINAVSLNRAMRYICAGKVEVLEEYQNYPVHPEWKAPAVVRLMHWIRPHKARVKFSRQNVLARDRYKCSYCGERKPLKQLTFDHVIPRSRGGRTCWENITTACVECNLQKADRTPEEAGMQLRKRPERPPWLPIFNTKLQGVINVPPEWRDYWSTELLP
jgi:5-methylcytosine-specific restriction endonuclease McrA